MNKLKDYFKGAYEVVQTVDGEDQVVGDVPKWAHILMRAAFSVLSFGLSRVLAEGLTHRGMFFIAKINGSKK